VPARTDAPVVAGIAEEHASVRALSAQASETRFDELAAHASPLERRLDRDGTEREPALKLGRAHR
jgi:hypothetical protein